MAHTSFGGFLKKDTTPTVSIGPFLSTDLKTPETGLETGSFTTGNRLIFKNADGGTVIDGTFAEIDDTDRVGWYTYLFTAAETDTVGRLAITFSSVDLDIVPLTFFWQVLDEDVFDALIGDGADGFNVSGEVKIDSPSQTAIRSLAQGTASSNSLNTLTLIDTGKTEAGDFWNDMIILITSGPLAGLTRRVVNFDESLDTFTFDVPLDSIIQAGVTYEIIAVGNASVNIQTDLNSALADSVSADGAFPSVNQALYMIWQFLAERSVAGTTVTVTKPDGSTGLMTFTLDSGSSPTSITRAT